MVDFNTGPSDCKSVSGTTIQGHENVHHTTPGCYVSIFPVMCDATTQGQAEKKFNKNREF